MSARKARGPRTPEEKATDAARTAATLFAKLPPSHYADRTLRPLSLLLRFDQGSDYVDAPAVDAAARAYLELVEWWEWLATSATAERIKRQRQRVAELQAMVDDLAPRISPPEAPRRPELTLVPDDDER
jgi:hypothetical protein